MRSIGVVKNLLKRSRKLDRKAGPRGACYESASLSSAGWQKVKRAGERHPRQEPTNQ